MESSNFVEWGPPSSYAETQDLSTICRICANSHESFIQIYSNQGRHHGLAEKINTHLPISISQMDVLPTQICYQCTSTILAFNDLIETCMAAEKRFRNLICHQTADRTSMAEHEGFSIIRDHNNPVIQVIQIGNGAVPTRDGRELFSDSLLNQTTSKGDNGSEHSEGDNPVIGPDEDQNQTSDESDCNNDDEIPDDMFRHKKKKKKRESISKCGICGKVFQFTEYLKTHLLSHSNNRPHQCHICGATFKRKDHVNHHRKTVHMNHPDVLRDMERRGLSHLSCDQCGEVRPTPHLMLLHKKKHTADLACNYCDERFNMLSVLKEHMTSVHADEHAPCTLCGEITKSGREMFLHRQKHSASFICDVCGKSFAQQSTLRAHMVIHSDERPYTCDECGKSFKLKTRLQLHKKSHADLRPYACSLCKDKRFKTRTALVVHNNMHNDVRRYPCPHCTFRARKNSDLVCHVRTHTGEKPYKCDVCSRGFAQAGDMRKHKTTHERQRIEIPKG